MRNKIEIDLNEEFKKSRSYDKYVEYKVEIEIDNLDDICDCSKFSNFEYEEDDMYFEYKALDENSNVYKCRKRFGREPEFSLLKRDYDEEGKYEDSEKDCYSFYGDNILNCADIYRFVQEFMERHVTKEVFLYNKYDQNINYEEVIKKKWLYRKLQRACNHKETEELLIKKVKI